MASLVAGNGDVLTPVSFPLPVPSFPPLVIAHGTDYAVISADPSGTARLTTISRDGREVRTTRALPGVVIAAPSAASNGSEILLVNRSAPVEAHLIRSDGTVMRITAPLPLSTTTSAVIANGSGFVIATGSQDGLSIHRVGRDGSSIAPGPVVVTTAPVGDIKIASSGDEIVAVFLAITSPPRGRPIPGEYALRTAAIARDGTVAVHDLGPILPIPLSIVWAETSYVTAGVQVVYQLGRDGKPIASARTDAAVLRLAARGSLVYAVGHTNIGVRGQAIRVAGPLSVAPATTLSVTLRRQSGAAIASDGIDFLAAWTDIEPGRQRDATIRIARTGERIDSEQRDIGPLFDFRKRLVFGATRFLLVPRTAGATDDLLFDEASDAAWNGSSFLAVSIPGDFFPATFGIYGRFIFENGTRSAPALITALSGGGYYSNLRVAFDGRRYVIAWISGGFGLGGDLYAIRVASNGAAIDAVPTLIAPNVRGASLASNGRDVVIVFDSLYDVRMRIVDTSRSPLAADAEQTVFRWLNSTVRSAVTFDGRDYVIGMQYGSYPLSHDDGGLWWIAMARTNGGVVTTRTGTASGVPEGAIAIAGNRIGDSMIAVSEFPVIPGIARIRAYPDRELPPLPQPPVAPSGVIARGAANHFEVRWNSTDPTVSGFVLETKGLVIATVPASMQSVRLSSISPNLTIRSFNAAGASQPVDVTVARQRTVR